MTDQPYTDDDLRAEAVKYTSDEWDSLAISEDLSERDPWRSLGPDQFKIACGKVVDLATEALDLSTWAVNLGADGLQATDHTVQLGVDPGDGDRPRVRLHFAFHPDMPDADRDHFVMALSKVVLRNL
ncbi:hypothetical protein UK15_07850 [Streptomyces variegatus]|uniref:Uncharacterized protein n=1 Tax=Streptomyces variegatus TaxID=284040 RepID=A0A0M2GQY0_9ACTN|nr:MULTISPECIES: hypothetical protein [Streptomyces]KJK40252.1 hypothetical protein UK15_07850 [Streptomyces variegatus]